MVSDRPIYLRPGVSKFIRYCLDTFRVAIWSSMMPHNLSPIVQHICRMCSIRPTAFSFIYSQLKCEEVPRGNPKKPLVPLLTKPFHKIQVPIDHLNTLLIDDTPEKGKCNGEYTYISPIEYDGNPQDNFLETRLMPYLDSLAKSPLNVPNFVSQYPFM